MKQENFGAALREHLRQLRQQMSEEFQRHVSVADLLSDRWETAEFYGFGEGTSCYNNVLILGQVSVGKNTWIGPNVILDGSSDLQIGDFCSIGSGVQIYTHSTVNWSTSLGEEEHELAPTRIGNGVFIGPNSVIEMGVTIGDRAVVGAMSFVNRDVPEGARVFGSPARDDSGR